MNYRSVTRISRTLAVAVLALGCSEDYNFTEPVVNLQVTPQFIGIDEGTTTQLQATFNGAAVPVTWSTDNNAIMTVSPTGLVTGVSAGITAAIATLTSDPTQKRSASITVVSLPILANAVARTGLSSSGARGSFVVYKVIVPAGKTRLTVRMSGGTGDADLFVRRGTKPTAATFDCSSELGGNDEQCIINNPAADTWFVGVMVWDAYAGASLTATLIP